MGSFQNAMRRFATLENAALADRWTWRTYPSNVRYAVVRGMEEEQAALARARRSWRPTEVEGSLALARRAFGDLAGLLIGLPDTTLDDVRDGPWSLRRVLTHLIEIERRYAAQTFFAAHRGDDEPLRMAEGDPRLPAKDGPEVPGGIDTLIARLAAARDSSDGELCGIPDTALDRPADWAGARVDVRLRLHRFASHLVEHTLQCEKALEASGTQAGEARRVVRRIWSLRGELEATGDDEAMAALDAAHEERAGSV